MTTYHCKRCCRAIFRGEHVLRRVNLWDLGEYQAEAFAVSALIDEGSLTRYDASLHEGWYCCRFIAMRMVFDKFGTGDDLLVYADSVVASSNGVAPKPSHADNGQVKLSGRDFERVLSAVENRELLLVVKFGAIWCPPCR